MMKVRTELGFSGQIWAIMLGFGPFCYDLGHIAWIWAIWQNLGPNRPQRRRSPEDGAGGTYVRTYGQNPPVFYRTLSPSGPLPKKVKVIKVKVIKLKVIMVKVPRVPRVP